MADFGTVLSVAQTLFAAVGSPLMNEICSILGFKSELEDLKNTVSTVRAVLLDAEAKQEQLTNEARGWIEKLKLAIYDADDLLDEFTTLAEQIQNMEGSKFSKEVRLFFSRLNQINVAYNMSRGIKKIRKKLDAIARDHSQFGVAPFSNEPIKRRSRETCSYVFEQNIIGREEDKRAIIDILLDSNVQEQVSFVTIVGIGGMGKTTLAQLVFNDKAIEKEFPLKLWVCVSDQDQKHLDVKAILCKILESAKGDKCNGFELDCVQSKLQKELEGRKYLLVLDDVWNENRDECLRLGEYLMCGASWGSRIVVTTRSKETAKVVGKGPIYVLDGLSPENSWCLFERLAFDQEQREIDPELVVIGKDVVSKCVNVPLAIRTVGTLLYGQGKAKWLSFQKNGLSSIRKAGEDNIVNILKLSYHQLDSRLKSCFSFCAIFPKDSVMEKETLISLWMAQGFVEPLDEGQSLDVAANEYFSILLRRCFFQDVVTDEYGEIWSCKMHDLMHDIAQEVAGKEICAVNSCTSKLDEEIRHLFVVENEDTESNIAGSKIRTFLHKYNAVVVHARPLGISVVNCKYLRALDLCSSTLKSLPSTIGRLVHLRYLNLSHNIDVEALPKEITKLHNLQTLKLRDCRQLKELPRDLTKLEKLRELDVSGCQALTCMPSGIEKLTRLCKLPMFVVAEGNSSGKHRVGELDDLTPLINLEGSLLIEFPQGYAYMNRSGKGGYLRNKAHLNEVLLFGADNEMLVEDLQPHPNLKCFFLKGYHCVNYPSWAREDNLRTFLPNLVTIRIYSCQGFQYLPSFGNLRHLKSLHLNHLLNLEFMENASSSSCAAARGSESSAATFSFFPSLEELDLSYMPKLRGWWRGSEVGDDQLNDSRSHMQPCLMPQFPRISRLRVSDCRNLTSVPLCLTLEDLDLERFNERLRMMMSMDRDQEEAVSPSSFSKPSSTLLVTGDLHPKLKNLKTDNVRYLKCLPVDVFQCLSNMQLHCEEELENLSELKEVFKSCSSSLRSLVIFGYKPITLSDSLEHLTALESLQLSCNLNVNASGEEDTSLPWRPLNQSLRSLKVNILQLVELPKGIQHLTALQTLDLCSCGQLEDLPDWISCLSSLQVLEFSFCRKLKSLPDGIRKLTSLRRLRMLDPSPELRLRCQEPDGEDWPKVQHIPDINIR